MPRKSAASSTGAAPTSPTSAQAPGDTSIISTATEPKSPATKTIKKKDDDALGIEDLLLPRTLTSRIARGTLPANTSLQKDAILALTKSATVFISALASTANDLTTKKTISTQDVLKALEEMELGHVMELGKVGEDGRVGGRLERELAVFEEGVRGKRKGYREKVKARESAVGGAEGVEGTGEGGEEGEGNERGEPEKKRVRMDEEDEEALIRRQLNGGGEEGEGMHEDEEMDTRRNEDMMEDDVNDDTEDDPDLEDNEDEKGDDEDDEAEEEQEHEREGEDSFEVDDSRPRDRPVLAPDGRAEVGGSDDESD